MAIPTPDSLIDLIKPTPTDSTTFLDALSAMMSDETTVKNGYRLNGVFSFYVPGILSGTNTTEIKNALIEAGYKVRILTQIYGYMPTNEWVDFKSASPADEGVTGPSTFPWVHVQIIKA